MQREHTYEEVSIRESSPTRISLDGYVSDGSGQAIRRPEQPTIFQTSLDDDTHYSKASLSFEKEEKPLMSARTPRSSSMLWQVVMDSLLILPGLAFITYAIITCRYDGTPVDEEAVSALQSVAKYGPTIFPIAFSAVMANLLKSLAAWRLEHGISILSLQFLLGSRTVFSSISTPITVRAINSLTLPLIAVWLLSPFGGQAALRVIGEAPSTNTTSWNGQYLEFMGDCRHRGAGTSAGTTQMPAISGAFMAALLSPGSAKRAGRDAFGNVKIPMVESYVSSWSKPTLDKWYEVGNKTDTVYSSLSGLNIVPSGGFQSRMNYSLIISTSYMKANCTLEKSSRLNWTAWTGYMLQHKPGRYHNGEALVIDVPPLRQYRNIYNISTIEPYQVIFTSWTPEYLTNATCTLRQSYVEVDIACQESECHAFRIRPDPEPRNSTLLTVMDGITPSGRSWGSIPPAGPFFETLMNVTRSAAISPSALVTKRRPSPLEFYFVSPDSPYSGDYTFNGSQIWPIGEELFSQRFSQLINTYWLNSVAPYSMTGNFTFINPEDTGQIITSLDTPAHNVTGTMVPDVQVLRVDRPWLVMLFAASFTMVLCAITAVVLGTQRKGPDILDYVTALIKDNPFVKDNIPGSSMEEGPDRIKQLKDVVVFLGDATPQLDTGYVAIGTAGEVVSLARQPRGRVYS